MHVALELLLPASIDPAWAAALAAAVVVGASVSPMRRPRRRERDFVVVGRIAAAIHRPGTLPHVLEPALEEIVALLQLDGGCLRIASTPGQPPVGLYRGLPPAVRSAIERADRRGLLPSQGRNLQRAPALVNLAAAGRPSLLGDALRKEGFEFFALHPVFAGDQIVGALGLASRKLRRLRSSQREALRAVSDVIGVAIASASLRDQSNKLSDDLVALQEVNKIISQSLNLEEIMRRIVAEGKRLVKTSECHLLLTDERAQALVGAASTRSGDPSLLNLKIDLAGSSVAVAALLKRHVVVVEDLPDAGREEVRLPEFPESRAAIFAPLLTKDQAIGVLMCSDSSPERRFAEEEILRAETLAHQAAIALENARLFQVVSRSQKEWETTFDAMQDCVSVHDMQGKVVRANLALARRLGTVPRALIGKYCAHIYGAGTTASRCRHSATEPLLVEELELPAMGGTFQVAVNPWYDKNNNLAGSIHVAKDVSNEKLLQQQLIQSEKLSAIGELISGIAHELNNPLTGVMGYSQLLQLRNDLDDRARENLLKINNLALRCQKIVQNLLSFARKQKPERTSSDINDILERTIELRNYELSVNDIEIERRLDPSLPRTIADAHQLQQVFLNVITNAEQAMLDSHGRGKLVLQTRADLHKERIVIEISDNGPGIPEAHLTRIFDPFFTTKEVGRGTGLGLSLSYGIIKEHGGNIYARSKVGEGATFVVELPIIAAAPEARQATPELQALALKFENVIRGKRILVVDDEQYILDFFVEVFQMFPLEVETASNGLAARTKIENGAFDLVITDFKMPQMSGRELYEWIKRERPDLTRRIIFVTGDTVSVETRSFLEKNETRVLAKPFKIEEVQEIIEQALEDNEPPNGQ